MSREIIKSELETLRQELLQEYEASGRKASGDWAESLLIESGENSGTLYAGRYIEGRPPGKMPPIFQIEQWIKAKGIAPVQKNIETGSLAFLIARKIAQKGTQQFREREKGIIESVITPEKIQAIIDKTAHINVKRFTENIEELLKQTIHDSI